MIEIFYMQKLTNALNFLHLFSSLFFLTSRIFGSSRSLSRPKRTHHNHRQSIYENGLQI